MAIDETDYLETPNGRLAFRFTPGDPRKATLVWCGGLKSDMKGGKATMLHAAALADNRPYLRFDYRGHGESDVDFAQTCVSMWREDTLTVIDHLTTGPVVLIGSSMGGWTSMLASLARPDRVRGLVLIAPAPDFSEKLMWPTLPEEARREIMEKGFWMRPANGDPPYPLTRLLIEDGRKWLITDNPIKLDIPVRILQGKLDVPVPWKHALMVADLIEHQDVQFTLVKDGDHRLSRDADLALIRRTVQSLADQVDSAVSA